MGTVAAEFIEEARRLGIELRELSTLKCQALRAKVTRRWASGPKTAFLWEGFDGAYSLQEDLGWHRIVDFPREAPLVLFFEPEDEESMLLFSDGASLVRLLDETYWDEVYVTDEEGSFLICYNDHGFLIGAGDAAGWVYDLKPD